MIAYRLFHAFATFVPAGPQVRMIKVMTALGDEFRHSVVAIDGKTGAADRIDTGSPIELVATPPRAGSLKTTVRICRLLSSIRPDLVLTYNWGAFDALVAAHISGVPVIHQETGFDTSPKLALVRRRIWACRLALPRARALIVPSRSLLRTAVQVWRMPEDRLHHVANGIDVGEFAIAEGNSRLRAQYKIPDDAIVIGTVAHLRPIKNLGRLLNAIAMLNPQLGVHVLIVGDGPERSNLALHAEQAAPPGRVHFAGYQQSVSPFYQAMDILALSSESEQMPMCLLEGMASGLPVIATDVGDIRVILPKEQAEWLVPLRSESDPVAGLHDRFERMARDIGVRHRLGRLNREQVEERYSFSAMSATYRDLYRRVCDRRQSICSPSKG